MVARTRDHRPRFELVWRLERRNHHPPVSGLGSGAEFLAATPDLGAHDDVNDVAPSSRTSHHHLGVSPDLGGAPRAGNDPSSTSGRSTRVSRHAGRPAGDCGR